MVSEEELVADSVDPLCRPSHTITDNLVDSVAGFCGVFENFIDWGGADCKGKDSRKLEKKLKRCDKAKKLLNIS